MTNSEQQAFRGTLAIFAAVLGVVFVVGIIGDQVGHDRSNFEKAEGFFEAMHTMAAEIPRLPNGSILRQGMLSTAWLDDVGALPARIQAMPGSLRGQEDQHSVGLVRRGPWTASFLTEARDSLIWTTLTNVPRVVCEQLVRAAAQHPDQVAYVTVSGDPVGLPAAAGSRSSPCRGRFGEFTLIVLDAPTEFRRLSDDIQNAVREMPKNLTGELAMSGSSAPFQVGKSKDGSPGHLQNGPSGVLVTITNVPLAVCRLALLAGPQAFGMDLVETADGKTTPSSSTRAASDALCNALGGRLVMSRRWASAQ
jgi:hypothetical protein